MSTQTETGLIPEDLWWGWAPEAWLPWHSVLLAHRTLVRASKLQPLPKSELLLGNRIKVQGRQLHLCMCPPGEEVLLLGDENFQVGSPAAERLLTGEMGGGF